MNAEGVMKMKYQRTAASLAALSMIITGCGANAALDGGRAAEEAPVQQPAVPAAPAPALPAEEEPGPAAETAETTDDSAASGDEAEQTQDYYMDGNYIIRPKTEDIEKKVVLLTFDDGPKDEEILTSILDTLDQYQAKAIFFINGYRAEQKPELVELIHERGQPIGNHSWDHIDLKEQTEEELEQQIGGVQQLAEKLTGEAPAFFRPPFGSGGDAVKAKAAEHQLLYMTWSNGSRDWMSGYQEPAKIIGSVLEQLHSGSNILMHELPWTAEALDELLQTLQEKGYRFVDPAQIDPLYSKK